VGAYIAYRHDPLSALPDPEAQIRAFEKLKLLVAIDVNYSETAWYADVILPEATYLERANILTDKSGLKPGIAMRDQAVAPRLDTRRPGGSSRNWQNVWESVNISILKPSRISGATNSRIRAYPSTGSGKKE